MACPHISDLIFLFDLHFLNVSVSVRCPLSGYGTGGCSCTVQVEECGTSIAIDFSHFNHFNHQNWVLPPPPPKITLITMLLFLLRIYHFQIQLVLLSIRSPPPPITPRSPCTAAMPPFSVCGRCTSAMAVHQPLIAGLAAKGRAALLLLLWAPSSPPLARVGVPLATLGCMSHSSYRLFGIW